MNYCKLHSQFFLEENGLCIKCQFTLKKNRKIDNLRIANWRRKNPDKWEKIKSVTPSPIGSSLSKELRKQKKQFKHGKISELSLTVKTKSFANNLHIHMNKYYNNIPYKIVIKEGL